MHAYDFYDDFEPSLKTYDFHAILPDVSKFDICYMAFVEVIFLACHFITCICIYLTFESVVEFQLFQEFNNY